MELYEAPLLNDEGISSAIRTGLLGDQIAHVTIEQLKSSSPALALQICVSILQKLDVDVDCLGQHFFQPHLSSPENYQSSTFFAVHVPQYFHKLVPGCTQITLCTADLIRPSWKKMRKFLSVIINYLRFEQSTVDTFQQISCDSEDFHKNLEDVEAHNDKILVAIKEIEEYMIKNAAIHQQQNAELNEVEEEMQRLDHVKKECNQRNKDAKKVAEKLKTTLVHVTEQIENVLSEIDQQKQLVVNSPEKQISEKNELNCKLELVKDESAEVQDHIQTVQWNIDKNKETTTRMGYALKQLTKYQEFYEKLRSLKSKLMGEQFQTNECNMSSALLKHEIDKTKQLKVDERDQFHRNKLRSQHDIEKKKQCLSEINKKSELLLSQAQDKEQEMVKLRLELENEKINTKKVNENHEMIMQKVESTKSELLKIVEQTYTNANSHIINVVSKRKAKFDEFVDS